MNKSANIILSTIHEHKTSDNIIFGVKAWYDFVGKNRTEEELDYLANILGSFFNMHYSNEPKKYENLFIILSSALIETDTDHIIDTLCSKLKNDVDSLDETEEMMLNRIINI